MPLLRRLAKVDRDVEKRLLTGLILSDKVLEQLQPYLQPEVLELDVTKEILKWIKNYHAKYKKAPKDHLRDLFLANKSKLRPQVIEEVEQFLAKLSEEYLYDAEKGQPINEDFIIDRGLQYLRERHLRQMLIETNALLDAGEIEKAEKLAEGKKSIISKTEFRWVKPFDDIKYMNYVFDERENPLVTLKGKLGELIGPLYRGWLMGVMGPFKRGKTWDLQDIAVDCVLSKLRVALASLEMADKHQTIRVYSQIGQLGTIDKEYDIPVFDCKSNQDNSCTKRQRVCHEERPEKFEPNQTYKPCTACRDIPKEEKDFKATSWYIRQKRPGISRKNVRKELEKLNRMIGSNLFRLISYPAFSATLTDLEDDLEELERQDGFIPDVIVIDYADILQPEDKRKEHRHQIDEIWKRLKGMAYERSCLVVSGSQSNRASTDKEILDEKDIAEEARKLAHGDVWIGLNQTQKEKEQNIWRIGVIEHRWKEFNKKRQLLALQDFELGQPILDGELVYYEYKKGK